MTYTFRSVDIIAFDVRTAIKPLAIPKFLKSNFTFLADGKSYAQQYESGQVIEMDSFTIRPIKKREFSRNHFWKNYAGMSVGFELDYWGLQIPFVFEPKNFDLKVNTQGLTFKAEVEPVVYLNSIGWSSNIKLQLTGEIKPEQLQEFVGRLRGFDQSHLPFILSGQHQSLTSVFKRLGHIVKNGIYTSPDNVGDRITVSNQLIISLSQATGPLKYFNEEWGLTPHMDDDERAELLGILYGRKINVEEVKRYQDSTLVTRFRSTNFSLTNFDQGTLLYMQEEAAGASTKTESLGCLASNVRSCTMMSLTLLNADHAINKTLNAAPMLKSLQERAQAALASLPDSYNNAYCRNLYRHHKRLKKFSGDEEAEDIEF